MARGAGPAPVLALTALCLFGAATAVARSDRLTNNFEVLVSHAMRAGNEGRRPEGMPPGAIYNFIAARSLLQSDVDRELLRAAQDGNATRAEEALDGGADVKAKFGRNGKSPLLVAANAGHLEVVELLIRAGADLDESSEDGRTPVAAASFQGHLDVLLALLRGGASPHKAAFEQKRKLFKDPAAKKRHDLEQALKNAGLEVGAAVTKGITPLMLAIWFRHTQIVEVLLRWGARVDQRDEEGLSTLHFISFLGIDPAGKNAPSNAPSNTTTLIAGMLIDAGADVDAVNKFGDTPLHYATFADDPDLVKFLVQLGASVDVLNSDGKTPLFSAATYGNLVAAQILVDAGADVSITNEFGETAKSLVCGCAMVGKRKKNLCQEGRCTDPGEIKALKKLLSF